MSQQNYRPCPCGSGKKVKFCCKELANDLDKVLRAVEGEQRAAALQHLDRLIAEHRQLEWSPPLCGVMSP